MQVVLGHQFDNNLLSDIIFEERLLDSKNYLYLIACGQLHLAICVYIFVLC